MKMKVKEAIAFLEAKGWRYSHSRGDHRVFKKPGHRSITVAGHINEDLSQGMSSTIRREAKQPPLNTQPL